MINTLSKAGAASLLLLATTAPLAHAQLHVGPEETIQSSGVDITRPNDAAAAGVDWNEDGLCDLVVTNGYGSTTPVKVRVFINVGTADSPLFNGFFFAQAGGGDLQEPGSG